MHTEIGRADERHTNLHRAQTRTRKYTMIHEREAVDISGEIQGRAAC